MQLRVAWSRGDTDTLNRIFGFTVNREKGKPTNSEFIAMISDNIRLKLKGTSPVIKNKTRDGVTARPVFCIYLLSEL